MATLNSIATTSNLGLGDDHGEDGVATTAIVVDNSGCCGSTLVANVEPRLHIGETLDNVGGEPVDEGPQTRMFPHPQLWEEVCGGSLWRKFVEEVCVKGIV